MTTGVQVRGNASAEELAAVVAVLAQVERTMERDRYDEWRRVRLAAVRAGVGEVDHSGWSRTA